MVDPTDALTSFQEAYTTGLVAPQNCDVHKEAFVLLDEPLPNQKRFSYVLIEFGEVIAFANLSLTDPLDGKVVFQIGYAVPPAHRGKGLARRIAKVAIDEIDHGFRRANSPMFYVEASVIDSNIASQRVAQNVFGDSKQSGADERTGETLKLYRVLLGKKPFEL
ncbi:MAG: GNAT family N-acetyltransferase [Rhizobiales bacterium]|nr:GNAT family N-acetyltransferase [Hyphomicrobiales bacterium]